MYKYKLYTFFVKVFSKKLIAAQESYTIGPKSSTTVKYLVKYAFS